MWMNSTEGTTSAFGPVDFTTVASYQRPFTDGVTIFSGVVIFLFMIIGILLNSLTITVIETTASLRNIFMYFIVSLCSSDLMSALISPLFWYRRTLGFDVWMPPNFFCKLFWAMDLMTSFSTSMHILNFAVLRYISVQHPGIFKNISKRSGKIWIAITWFIAFMCGFVPLWIFTGAIPGQIRDRNSGEPNAKWPACTLLLETLPQYKTFSITAYSIFLLLPMLVVIVVSVLIGKSVHNHTKASVITNDEASKKRIQKEKQAVLQLILIVVSFLFGYVPFVTYEIWSLFPTDPVADYWFGLIQYFCLRFSECMNPVFYNISSTKMRRHTFKFLRKIFKCCPVWNKQPDGVSTVTTTMDANTQMGV
ncbi:growth hormone secretagogue receptor type 1-like [Styela clava]